MVLLHIANLQVRECQKETDLCSEPWRLSRFLVSQGADYIIPTDDHLDTDSLHRYLMGEVSTRSNNRHVIVSGSVARRS
jgi:hypothetical protein